jgi:hypothetical protein
MIINNRIYLYRYQNFSDFTGCDNRFWEISLDINKGSFFLFNFFVFFNEFSWFRDISSIFIFFFDGNFFSISYF